MGPGLRSSAAPPSDLRSACAAPSSQRSAFSPCRGSPSARSRRGPAPRAPPTGASPWAGSPIIPHSGRAPAPGAGSGSSSAPSISPLRMRTASTSRCGPSSGRSDWRSCSWACSFHSSRRSVRAGSRMRLRSLRGMPPSSCISRSTGTGSSAPFRSRPCCSPRHCSAWRARPRSRGVLVRRRAVVPATAALVAVGAVAWAGGHFTTAAAEDLRAARWGRALTDANRARRFAPWSSEASYLRGEALRAVGREAAARESFRRGLELDPGDAVLWRALARVSSGAELRQARERLAQLDPRGAER